MKQDVTILVNSCDLYEDAWDPFFRLLKIQWPDCAYPVILNTETKEYHCDFMDVRTVKSGKKRSWSARLKYALDQIETRFVLFSLEDFFLTKPVNTPLLETVLEQLRANPKLGGVTFRPLEVNDSLATTDDPAQAFKVIKSKQPYRIKVLVSLYDTNYLKSLILGDENPWVFEREFSIRSLYAGRTLLTQDYACSVPIFSYAINPKLNLGITQRKWLNGNKAFFESHGIVGVNYDHLGIMEESVSYKSLLAKNQEENRTAPDEQATHKPTGLKERVYGLYKRIGIKEFRKRQSYRRYYKKHRV